MSNKKQGKSLRDTESHLQDGPYWQNSNSTSKGRTPRPSDPDLTDPSEEESRRHNERIDAEDRRRHQKRQLQEGSTSKHRKKARRIERKRDAEKQTSDQLADKISELHRTVQLLFQSKTAAEAHAFLPKESAMKPTQPDESEKILAKKTSHTHRVKETRAAQEVREKKRCQGIVKAWTFSMWLWEGSPPPLQHPQLL